MEADMTAPGREQRHETAVRGPIHPLVRSAGDPRIVERVDDQGRHRDPRQETDRGTARVVVVRPGEAVARRHQPVVEFVDGAYLAYGLALGGAEPLARQRLILHAPQQPARVDAVAPGPDAAAGRREID